jgi:hypothetical protein
MPGKIYEVQWRVENGLELQVADGDSPECFVRDFPHEFEITKVIAVHTAGTLASFTLDIHNLPTENKFPVGDESESLFATTDPVLAKVIPTQTSTGSPDTVELFAQNNGGPGWHFRNMEGTHTVPKRRIFITITTTGQTGTVTVEMAIAGIPAVGY